MRLKLVAGADVVAVFAFLGALWVAWTGGDVWRIAGVRLSITSPLRLCVLGAGMLAVRHLLVPRPHLLTLLVRSARAPLPFDEALLFERHEMVSWRRMGRFAWLVLGFAALVAAMTWPQARHLYSVPDYGDPLFSIWRLAWVSHQLPRNPLALFDANIFYPERLTFTYSDSMIVPALAIAPLFWLGAHPVPIYNLLFLAGFVFSGVTTFLLVRALTGHLEAAIVAGAIFALYPYRWEHYSHLELQMAMWMPLALWALHRTMAMGRLRDGLATGVAFALQTLSSLYYGLFLAVYMFVVAVVLWLSRKCPARPVRALAGGALVAATIVAPVASQYVASQRMRGDRHIGTVESYSAEGPDYLKADSRSAVYAAWAVGGQPERQLFPRLTPVVLSAVALWPPLSAARIGYTLALVVAFDGSLGLNGKTFAWLHDHVSPFRRLRVPARFSIFVGLTLAILSGYGTARLLIGTARARMILTGAILSVAVFEAVPRSQLVPVWREPPQIYSAIASQPQAVLAEFPIPGGDIDASQDTRYLYFSTWHWHSLVNGNSGFFPPSYQDLLAHQSDFPSDAALNDLRLRGVNYIAVHGAFYKYYDRYRRVIEALDARSDLELVAAAEWDGSESRLYRLCQR